MHYQWRGNVLIIKCLVQPRASRNEIVGIHDQHLKVAITAPPVDGKANQHLVKLLSQWFGVSRQQITMLKGESGRRKTIAIENPSCIPDQAGITKEEFC